MATSAPLQSGPIANALQLLRKLYPPQSLIHVGAGNGAGDMQQWQRWNIDKAWIIDANPDCLQWAETLATTHPDWHVICAILCESHGNATWHQASNPDEHGLINPEQLKSIWPNLHTTSEEARVTQSLDYVLEDCGEIPDASWLFIDCLPALPILKGASKCLEHSSVLWLRVLLEPLSGIDDSASLAALKNWLQPLGYRCIETQEGNHPALGHALFVRNWQTALQTQNEKLTAEHEEQARLASQRQRQLDELIKNHTSDKDKHVTLIAELQNRTTALTTEKDRHAKLAIEREQQVETLTRLNAALEQEKSALTARIDVLQQEVATLTQARDEQGKLAANLAKTRDEQAKVTSQLKSELEKLQAQTKQKDQQITQLHADMTERDARQQMLNDEMTRAEAQIDLIKDVLFREPGL